MEQKLQVCYQRIQAPVTQNNSAYVAQRGYNLLSVKNYGKTIGEAGFVDVQDIDYTSGFIKILKGELEIFAKTKDEFIKVRLFSQI